MNLPGSRGRGVVDVVGVVEVLSAMKIAYIAAGAAGMYCGSCIHDNTAAVALRRRGHDVVLIPTYTPLRTDEVDISIDRVFYGAVNVFLQQKSRLARRLPKPLHWLLDRPALLHWVSRFAGSTDASELGDLTLSVLQGENGPQQRELQALCDWLENDFRPDVVHITNSLFLGMVRELRRRLKVPVVVAFQGEDLFLDGLTPAWWERVVAEMRARAGEVEAFVAPSRAYAEKMAELVGVPATRVHVIPLGLNLTGHAPLSPSPLPPAGEGPGVRVPAGEGPGVRVSGREGSGVRAVTIGFLSRLCPEKGLHLLVDAFLRLAREPGGEHLQLAVAGWLGERDRPFFEAQRQKIAAAGLLDRFRHAGEVDLAGKAAFLESLDVFSVPSVYRESKGLPILEALAHGVPVVVPDHGSLPEMITATGGGLLVAPESVDSLTAGLRRLIQDPDLRRRLGAAGRGAVHEEWSDDRMAERLVGVYEGITDGG
jgi:glycosyltransferase involved in cell wall biosynthesis